LEGGGRGRKKVKKREGEKLGGAGAPVHSSWLIADREEDKGKRPKVKGLLRF